MSRYRLFIGTTYRLAGARTGDLNATETGSDTAVLIGVVKVSGAFAVTETGGDTATLTGTTLPNFGDAVVAATTNTKALTTTATATVSEAVPSGNLVVVCVASDNQGSTSGATADDVAGVTDSAGNTYTYAYGWLKGSTPKGGASASVWYSVINNPLTTSSTITVTNTTSGFARCFYAAQFELRPGSTVEVQAAAGGAADAGVDPVATLSGLPAGKEYLFIGCVADEINSTSTLDNVAASPGFTRIGSVNTTSGQAVTNMAVGAYWARETVSSKTFTGNTVSDAAAVLVVFKLGVPSIVGNLAATETGSDTAAVSGTLGVLPVTGSMAVTETGSDTAALTGTVPVAGTLAATETGSDTAAITGQVPIAGTFAATETGSDTAAIIGQLTRIGTLAATETGSDIAVISADFTRLGGLVATEVGSDTAALTGEVPVAGTLAATEIGEDTAAISGEVAITGSLSAAEIGTDTAAIDGGLIIAGTMSAVEAGADTAALNGTVLVSGSLNATETGLDTAVIAGGAQAGISGDLAAQEVGSDTASIIGTVEDIVVEEEKDRLGTSSTRFEERRHKPPRKRKPLTLTKPLTEEQIRHLKDKIHEKRRAIWVRPEPVAEEPAVVESVPAFIQSDKGELEATKTAVAIAQARVELEKLREQRKAEIATREAEVNLRRKERITLLKRDIDEKKQKAMQLAIRNQEAVVALLLAA